MTILETSTGESVTLPCQSWATQADLCTPCDDYSVDSGLMDTYLTVASEILYALSGRQFPGECSETVRPCTRRSYASFPFLKPVNISGRWEFPIAACSCNLPDNCGCGELRSIRLGRWPIVEVTEVKVDGAVLDPTLYRVDEDEYLVRLRDADDSNPGWPCCQDLTRADTEDDTFSVTFTYGRNPPQSGIQAAAVLACELYRACDPEAFEGECRLPANVIQVARQGVTVLVNSAVNLFVPKKGQPVRVGLVEVDLFLASTNPHGLSSPMVVLSPDLPPEGRRVGTA